MKEHALQHERTSIAMPATSQSDPHQRLAPWATGSDGKKKTQKKGKKKKRRRKPAETPRTLRTHSTRCFTTHLSASKKNFTLSVETRKKSEKKKKKK